MLSRREAIQRFWGLFLSSPLLAAESEHNPPREAPLDGLINAQEFEAAARARLPPALYDHVAAGAGSERTLRRNREFFERITFRPRMLVDVSSLDTSTELLGQRLFSPILAGPSALQGRFHELGETGVAKGASLARTLPVISERTSQPLSAISGALGAQPWWAQTSPGGDLERLREAKGLRASGVVVTIDGGPARPLDVDARRGRAGADWPLQPGSFTASRLDAAAFVRRVRQEIGLPVIVKGVLTADAARLAVEAGAAGVCVSNHGGRVIDGVPATIEALPSVAEAVGGDAAVLVDGGFRRGSDILKALAFGADAVLLGRPVVWALAAYGAEGVQQLLKLLQSELALAMGLSGTPNIAAITPKLVRLHSR